MFIASNVRAANRRTKKQWLLSERMRSRADHPAGRARLAPTGNVHLLPAPDWADLGAITRLPERVR